MNKALTPQAISCLRRIRSWRYAINASSQQYRDAIDTALALLAGGDPTGAEARFRNVLAVAPDHAEAWHGLACVARVRNLPGQAVALAGKALAQPTAGDAQRARFHITLGAALSEAGQGDAAVAALNVAILLEPRDPRAHAALGQARWRAGRADDAILAYERAVELAADDTAYRQELASILLAEKHYDASLIHFAHLAISHAHDPAAHANHGAALFEAGHLQAAAQALRRAETLGPPTAPTSNNLGLVAMASGDLRSARQAFETAVAIAPADRRIAGNYATLLTEWGENEQAAALFRRIADGQVDEEAVRARFNLGTLDLAAGRMREGWVGYEARLQFLKPARPGPTWHGEETSEPVLITVEQGLGDIVQFLRYLPKAAMRAPLVLDMPEEVQGLVAMMPALDGMWGERLRFGRQAGLQCPLLSLPYVLSQDELPSAAPYLASAQAVVPGRVGIAWAGNPGYRFDRRRSLSLAAIEPLLNVAGPSFLSLQKGVECPAAMESMPLDRLAATAAAIASCDLVISVDTVIAHIAGALGRPTWLLNRFGGDWRWRGPDWYRCVRMFQATTPDLPDQAWPPVIEAATTALKAWSGGIFRG